MTIKNKKNLYDFCFNRHYSREIVRYTEDDVIDMAATALLAETPWMVADGSEADLDPAAGSVKTTWLVDPDALNRTLRLTATGLGADGLKGTADDQVAMTAFTDAINTSLKAWAEGGTQPAEWQQGALGAQNILLFEGDTVAKSLTATGLTKGQAYSFIIKFNSDKVIYLIND
jgi:hypothetical protein